ncbi:HAMP domain-containing histidine kinase [Rhodobacteraceae bacterium S2214]|nr:HAMP domain-containing histidine kinase [Rhodobacteraceae bacterium S2214]
MLDIFSTLKASAARIWRMTALRQTVLLTGVFIIVLVGAGIIAAIEVREEMSRRADDRIERRHIQIVRDVAAGEFDLKDLRNTGLERFLFTPETASQDRSLRRQGFFTDQRLLPRRRDDDSVWMFYGGAVSGGWLVVGQNIGEFAIFDEVLAQAFLWVGTLAAIVALVFGLLFGWRSQRRITAISAVLDQAAQGDLSARVHAKGQEDDLKVLGDQVDDAIARIDVLLVQARSFSANIAHDLKTPLTRLRIRLETALTGDGDPIDGIGAALEQTDRVMSIFDAILQLGKLDSGAMKQTFAPVDLAAVATELAETYAPVVEDSGRHFSTQISTVEINGDRVLLTQFLANLIENALRHTPEGSSMVLVANTHELGLMDDGPGIPAAERDRALEPLYRLEKSRTTEGAGLGLALAAKIADLHDARIDLSDNPAGQGLFARMIFNKK